jgi:sortase A
VIAGHGDTFFRRLREVWVGDKILIQRSGHDYNYQVVSTNVVSAGDTGVLVSEGPRPLTLITCYPMHYVGPAPKRLVIEARPVSS